MKAIDRERFAIELAEWLNSKEALGGRGWNYHVRLYDDEGCMGSTSPQALLLALLTDVGMIDLYSEEAGGSEPTDLSGLTSIDCYVG